MRSGLSLLEVVQATGGVPVGPAPSSPFRRVSIDSRTTEAGDLFLALVGDRHDGHAFVGDALKRGALAAVVSSCPPAGVPAIVVQDTLAALTALAAGRRASTSARVVAITGSNGKTSTKDLLARICSAHGATVASPRSFNNRIGLPLTLLDLEPDTRYCVVELGTSGPGEIASLADLALPDIGIITQVSWSHLSGLGDVSAVRREKLSLLGRLSCDGVAIVNGDDTRLRGAAALTEARVVTFGCSGNAHRRAHDISSDLSGTSFLYDGRRVRIPYPGRFHVVNTLAAIAASLELGIDLDLAVEIVARSRPTSMRFETVALRRGILLIDDAYNANPGSVHAALGELVALVPQERRVAVLGPMRELGPSSRRLHRVIGYRAACSLDRLVVVGDEEGEAYLEGARGARRRTASLHHVANADEAGRLVQELLRDGDAILVKASRAVGLDRVCALLRRELMEGADPTSRLLAAS